MKDLIIWVIVWYLVWGIYNIYFRWSWEKFSSDKYLPRGLYFLLSFLIVFYVYKDIVLFHLLPLIVAFIVLNLIGLLLSFNKNYYKKFNKDRFFILFQSFNILYQQTSVVIALFLLKRLLVNNYSDLYFGLFFGTVHLPLLLLPWIKIKYPIVFGCFIIGYIFSFLIQNFNYGIILSSLLHYLFYAWQIHYLKDEEKI